MAEKTSFRLRTVHWLGMAGMGRNVGYGVNKVFVAAMLQALKASQPVIGFVLGLEGLFGILLNPLTGWLSDRTTRVGFRRKVYILICLPGAAVTWLVFFFLHDATAAMVAIVIFYVFQQASTSPYQAWMPEIVAPDKWGLASGYLNLWWQVGNLLAFLVIPLVWSVSHIGAFLLTSILMIVGGLTTVLRVPEPAVEPVAESRARANLVAYAPLLRGNLLIYFIVHLLSWLAFEALASFFTLFILHAAHGTVLDSALAMSLFTVTGLIASVVVGRLYRRISPRVMLASALGLYGLFSLAGLMIHNMTAVFVVVGIEGVFWSTNLTVSYALAIELLRQTVRDNQREESLRGGLYGLNNLVESAGLLIAAPLAGLVIVWSGGNYAGMFMVSALASLVALFLVLFIRYDRASQHSSDPVQADGFQSEERAGR